jgi:hypothetical protein
MSMPRAAMSVATSTWRLASLNSASALVRAPWLLLPWIASAGDAILVQLQGELVRAVLGAREDEHLIPILRFDEVGQELALPVAIDRMHRSA